MWKKYAEQLKKLACAVVCARLFYLGLAVTYGAAVVGLDKGAVEVVATTLYVALAAVRH